MIERRPVRSVGATAFWFGLSLLVLGVNLASVMRARGGIAWLALLLAGLAAWMVYTNGRVLLAWYRERQARSAR